MPRVLTTAQLEVLRESGAEIISEPEKREVTLSGLEAVVDQLRAIAEASHEIAKKRHDELVRAIEKLAESDKGPDIGPAIESLRSAVTQPRVAYTHKIERDMRGQIESIASTPVKGDLH